MKMAFYVISGVCFLVAALGGVVPLLGGIALLPLGLLFWMIATLVA